MFYIPPSPSPLRLNLTQNCLTRCRNLIQLYFFHWNPSSDFRLPKKSLSYCPALTPGPRTTAWTTHLAARPATRSPTAPSVKCGSNNGRRFCKLTAHSQRRFGGCRRAGRALGVALKTTGLSRGAGRNRAWHPIATRAIFCGGRSLQATACRPAASVIQKKSP